MRALVAGVFAVVLLASIVQAGENPDARMYISFSPDEEVLAIEPEPYSYVTAYFCLSNVEAGVNGVWFRLSRVWEEYPGVTALPEFSGTKLWPGEGLMGDLWTGMYMGATSCQDDPVENFCLVRFLYLTGECCLKVLGHPDHGQMVRDCSNPSGFDYWCVKSHANIGGAVCPDGDCPSAPIESGSWGSVKALFR